MVFWPITTPLKIYQHEQYGLFNQQEASLMLLYQKSISPGQN